MFWFMQGTCFLPTFLVIWSSGTFIVSYTIAVLKRDVDVIFPYISDTGATPPESCVFGLMTTVTAFVGVFTVFARYKYVKKLNDTVGKIHPKLNLVAFCTGVLSCLGMCVVATFQETLVPTVHEGGAFIFFVSGVVYILLQSVVSYRLHPYGSSITLCHFRAFIAAVSILATFPMIGCAAFVKSTRLHWDTHDKDYILHVISAASEWTVAFGFVFFFFTYIREFQKFSLTIKMDMQYD